jgi:hypothetical protein
MLEAAQMIAWAAIALPILLALMGIVMSLDRQQLLAAVVGYGWVAF